MTTVADCWCGARPDGVVCVNPPANAPLSSALLASLALAAGNALVVRAPRSVPLGVMYVMRELIAPILDESSARRRAR